MRRTTSLLIGIDEVGRGAVAGPVVVAAVGVTRRSFWRRLPRHVPLRDSKKLTPAMREVWYRALAALAKEKRGDFYMAVARVSPKIIDEVNISKAANRAATRAVRRLAMCAAFPRHRTAVLLDGGLFLEPHHVPAFASVRTVVRADERFNVVKLASIVAKVTRDRAMARVHRRYPSYGFAAHKGYGTRVHYAALVAHGPASLHRLTFLKKFFKARTQKRERPALYACGHETPVLYLLRGRGARGYHLASLG